VRIEGSGDRCGRPIEKETAENQTPPKGLLRVKTTLRFVEPRPLILRALSGFRLRRELWHVASPHASDAGRLLIGKLDRDGAIVSDVVLKNKEDDTRQLLDVGGETMNHRARAFAERPDLFDPAPLDSMKTVDALAGPAGDRSLFSDVIEGKELEASSARASEGELRDLSDGAGAHLFRISPEFFADDPDARSLAVSSRASTAFHFSKLCR
jgi:hypothetical protein